MTRIVTPDMAQEFVELYAKGHSLSEIGRRYGITMQSVHSWLKRLDVPRRPQGRRSPVTIASRSAELRSRAELVVADYERGLSLRQLRVQHHLSDQALREILNGAGIDLEQAVQRARDLAHRHDSSTRAQWRSRYETGATTVELAAEFGCTDQTIRRGILAAGGTIRTPVQRAQAAAQAVQTPVES